MKHKKAYILTIIFVNFTQLLIMVLGSRWAANYYTSRLGLEPSKDTAFLTLLFMIFYGLGIILMGLEFVLVRRSQRERT
ncbi:hypothetical protein [Bacillus sp. EB01]|uniref:hypothetical protein n=1 Tax=Bacillus sp. EB01 TaxID=1347086 RepID=UPI0005C68784|nr:hypothetical protein [Bacillus sp. EB01]